MLARVSVSEQVLVDASQVAETVRLLLQVKISEESDRQSLRVATAALIVAAASLAVSLIPLFGGNH